MSHTPGPWTFEIGRVARDAPAFGFRIVGGIDKWHGIAGCAVYDPLNAECFSSDEMEANARLIAAAPDLLAALKQCVDRYTALINSGDCGFWNPETEAEVIAARAALAKAEG